MSIIQIASECLNLAATIWITVILAAEWTKPATV